jgi:hypothetical protein
LSKGRLGIPIKDDMHVAVCYIKKTGMFFLGVLVLGYFEKDVEKNNVTGPASEIKQK